MTEPTEEPVRCVIFYRALVRVVELHVDGRMFQGDATALSKGGWTFKLDAGERVRSIAIARVLEHQLLATPEVERSPEHNVVRMYRERDHAHHRDRVCGLEPDEVRRRLELDDQVFLVARPEELMEKPFFTPAESTAADASPPPRTEKTANTFTYSQRKIRKQFKNSRNSDKNQ